MEGWSCDGAHNCSKPRKEVLELSAVVEKTYKIELARCKGEMFIWCVRDGEVFVSF